MAQGRGGRVAVAGVDEDVHAVGCQHLQGGVLRRLAEGVRVLGHVQRAGDALAGTVFHDGLGDGHDVRLIERSLQAGPPVTGRAERNALARIAQIGRNIVVRIQERSEVNKVLGLGNCARAASHGTSMPDDGGTQHGMSGIRPL